ncbi:MAG: hypothetical protein R2751_18330 [Bacteroidales bacterium]
MDFDFGNILYIVVTLIALFAGLAGKKKPKKGSGGVSSGGGFFENLERALQGEVPQEFQEPIPEAEQAVEETFAFEGSRFTPVEDSPFFSGGGLESVLYEEEEPGEEEEDLEEILRGEEGIAATQLTEIGKMGMEEERTVFSDLVENFDARQAVIYSTILNRLDY